MAKSSKNAVKTWLAFIIWIITVVITIFIAFESLDRIKFHLENSSRVIVVENHGSVPDDNKIETITEDSHTAHYRDELIKQERVAVCWIVGIFVYAIAGCVLFFSIKSSGNAKSLLYVLLIVLNVVFVCRFPFGLYYV